MGEELFEGRPQCEDPRCPWCARHFLRWYKARIGQMAQPRKGETVSFAEAAATSIKPKGDDDGVPE